MAPKRHEADASSVDSAILAGGLGTRLRPVLSDLPKPLAPVNDRPFVTFLLDQLVAANLHNAVLCTGYRGDQLQAALGDRYKSLDIAYSQEPAELGTAGALRFAVERFQSDAVLVLNGDSYCDVDLKEFCSWHRQREANASIVLTKVDNSDRFGSVHTNPDGMITRFGEKVALQTGGWINAGIYLLARRLIEQIPAQRPVSLEREVFPEWIGRGFYGYQHLGLFLDIGTPESFAGAAQLLAAKEST